MAETPDELSVTWVEDGIEIVSFDCANQHVGIEVPRDPQEPHRLLAPSLFECFNGTIFPEDRIELLIGPHIMELP